MDPQSTTTDMIKGLNSLKVQLLDIIDNSGSSNEIMRKIVDLISKDPDNSDIYQFIILMNGNMETAHKSFKQVATRVINELIDSKISLIIRIEKLETQFASLNTKKGELSDGKIKLPFFEGDATALTSLVTTAAKGTVIIISVITIVILLLAHFDIVSSTTILTLLGKG